MSDQAIMSLSGGAGAAASLEGSVGALGQPALPLIGSTVLLVERDPAVAEALQAALELAGAEVLIAPTAAKALSRMAQFVFSAAVVEWCSEASEHRTLVRRLREEDVRALFRADGRPEALPPGVPVIPRSASHRELVAALAGLLNTLIKETDAAAVA